MIVELDRFLEEASCTRESDNRQVATAQPLRHTYGGDCRVAYCLPGGNHVFFPMWRFVQTRASASSILSLVQDPWYEDLGLGLMLCNMSAFSLTLTINFLLISSVLQPCFAPLCSTPRFFTCR